MKKILVIMVISFFSCSISEAGVTDIFKKILTSSKELSEQEKKDKEKLIKSDNYQVRNYASNDENDWERMEFIIDDYRFYAHRPGGMKVKRISDGKLVAMITNKFKIKFKNGGENLFVVKKYEQNTLEKKESGIGELDQHKNAIDENIYEKKYYREKKLPGKITFEYNGTIVLSWERAYIPKHNTHFFQLLALDDQPFHFYAIKDRKQLALNMAKFVKKIDIAVAQVKVELAKKYNLTVEEIDLIIKKRKQNYDKQIAVSMQEEISAATSEAAIRAGIESLMKEGKTFLVDSKNATDKRPKDYSH